MKLRYNKKAGALSGLFATFYIENNVKSYRHHEDTRTSVSCMSPVVGTMGHTVVEGLDRRASAGHFMHP
jgi:hypothetical protein